jgi:ATP-dependent DNA helicase RecQ
MAASPQLDEEQLTEVAEAVESHDGPVDVGELRDETGLSESRLTVALARLADAGALEIEPDGTVTPVEVDDEAVDEAVDDAAEAGERRRAFDRSRVDMIRAYAELRDCRRRFLLNYFGEPREEPCGHCDACEAGLAVAGGGPRPFGLGARVMHREWGDGVVQRYEGDKLVVLFDEVGWKTLDVDLVVDHRLLEAR